MPPDAFDDLRDEMRKIQEDRVALDQRESDLRAKTLRRVFEPPEIPVAKPDDSAPIEVRHRRRRRNVGDTLLTLLRSHPGAPFEWLAQELYQDPGATGKVTSVIDHLKNEGKVQNVARGKWEVVPE